MKVLILFNYLRKQIYVTVTNHLHFPCTSFQTKQATRYERQLLVRINESLLVRLDVRTDLFAHST